jgi:hypothetical protein
MPMAPGLGFLYSQTASSENVVQTTQATDASWIFMAGPRKREQTLLTTKKKDSKYE